MQTLKLAAPDALKHQDLQFGEGPQVPEVAPELAHTQLGEGSAHGQQGAHARPRTQASTCHVQGGEGGATADRVHEGGGRGEGSGGGGGAGERVGGGDVGGGEDEEYRQEEGGRRQEAQ